MSSLSLAALKKSHGMLALPFFKAAFFLSLALLVLTVGLPVWKVVGDIYGRPVIPVHYNIHFGVDRTGPWWYIFQLPAIGFVILLVNTVFAFKFWKREPMLSYVFGGATVALQAILFVAMIFVVSLILSYG